MSAAPPVPNPAGLSVFVPAYTDSGTIASMVIRAVKAASELTPDFEIIVVDDGSGDGTAEIADELLQELEPVGLLDVGCGSGVLSIAAAKLGFAPVVAMDVDEIAVAVTLDNARRNGVEIAAHAANALTDELPPVEAVVANVSLDVVELLLARLGTPWAVVSGYLDGEQPDVDRWWSRDRRELDGWAADLLEHA